MVQNARVKRVVSDGVVEVSLMRQMECGMHCDSSQCAGCSQKPTEEILALATNAIGAQAGDFVEVEPSSGHNISTSFVVFFLPCIGLVIGYLLGQSLFHLGDFAALGTAALGLVVSFIPAFMLNRSILNSKEPEFRILKFLQ